MTAKEYARTMREECYRQNKDIMQVTSDLWLEIADDVENLSNQAVNDYKNEVIKLLEEKRDYYYKEMENMDGCCVGMFNEYHSKGIAFNEALEILKFAVNATNGKNGG